MDLAVYDVAGVMRVLRSDGPVTRVGLGDRLNVTRAQVDQRLDQLRSLGLLEEVTTAKSTGGRRPRAFGLRARAGYLVSVALGVTGLSVATVDMTGTIVDERRLDSDIAAGPHVVLGEVVRQVEAMAGNFGGMHPWGVGISVPGPVDYAGGIVVSPPIMPAWDQFPIRDWLSAKIGVPCWLDNDANAMALGESRYGTGRDEANMIFVKLGTGIGSGIIMGGQLQRGSGGCAGDVGHLPVSGSTVPCRCGNVGCVEAVAGGGALTQLANELAADGRSPGLAEMMAGSATLTATDLVRAAELGDVEALTAVRQAGTRIGTVLAYVVSIINPSQLVLGGRMADAGEVLLASLRQALYARALPLASRDLIVRRSALGSAAALHGTAEMTFDELFSDEALAVWSASGNPSGLADLATTITRQRARVR
jgi:glucokinase-like ROK family protein